jgi:hypothetical protein
MIDTQKKYLKQALDTKYHETLDVKAKEYILITLHRPSNVDNIEKLKEIFDDFEKISKTNTLVYPIHPRTKKNLKKIGYLEKVESNKNIILQDPLGYLEFTCLIANCKYVITDSGGIQEETTALNIPCFTLRENTERPCTFIENHGTNQLISKISEVKMKKCKGSMDLWDGKSSERLFLYLMNFHNVVYCAGLNLGDQLNFYLLKKLYPKINFKFEYYKKNNLVNKEHILFCGSLLAISNKFSYILGAGFINSSNAVRKIRGIKYVRGPLTRNKLLNKNNYVPKIYGDPALLLPLIYKPKKENIKKNILFIPHKIDYTHYKSHINNINNCEILNIGVSYKETEKFLDKLNEYDIIITSTLHGLIMSLSYGKKVILVKSHNKLAGDNMKYKDFLESVNLKCNMDYLFDNFVQKNTVIIPKNYNYILYLRNNQLLLNQYNLINSLPYSCYSLNNNIMKKITNYKIIIETFLLEDSCCKNTYEAIDERIINFQKYTHKSITQQTYKNYCWIIYVNSDNIYLKEKISQIEKNKNIIFYFYSLKELLSNEDLFIETEPTIEGKARGNYKIRNYLKKKVINDMDIIDKRNAHIINMCIDDDDYISENHFKEINFYANYYLKSTLNDKNIFVLIENFNIYYTLKKDLQNIIGKKYVHGNKFVITKNNVILSGYHIPESYDADWNKDYMESNRFILEKPNSSFYYMRYSTKNLKHLTSYSKDWLIKNLISKKKFNL